MATAQKKPSLPKYTHWILLGMAFIVVAIFVVILLMPSKQTPNVAITVDQTPKIKMDPDRVIINDAELNRTTKSDIKITSGNSVRIYDVALSQTDPDLKLLDTCRDLGILEPNLNYCNITLSWAPSKYTTEFETQIIITYGPKNGPDSLKQRERITVSLSTIRERVAELKPEKTDTSWFENIVPELPKIEEAKKQPEPTIVEENCLRFASRSYDLSGRPNGWIVPAAGHYNYYGFADTKCEKPLGEYDPYTGFIYSPSLDNPAQKIGTDAERVNSGKIAESTLMPQLNSPTHGKKSQQQSIDFATIVAARAAAVAKNTDPEKKGFAANRLPGAGDHEKSEFVPISITSGAQVSSLPKNNKYVLRQFKPIPAVIVSDIRVESQTINKLPVQAVVERNVYADNERTIVIPTGTLMLGRVTDNAPGRYKAIGKIQIDWYRFVRPDGAEFNFPSNQPFSADAQGRIGVPGRGSTDYMEEFVMPMITSLVPAAVNLIAPISDKFVNQIDLNNNTVTQSGNMRSSELAKQEIISSWNRVAQKLVTDMMDNTTPPFIVPAGTRITVYSPRDLIVRFSDEAFGDLKTTSADFGTIAAAQINENDNVGQVRSTMVNGIAATTNESMAKSFATGMEKYIPSDLAALQSGIDPYAKKEKAPDIDKQIFGGSGGGSMNFGGASAGGALCEDGTPPNQFGCCAGEEWTPAESACCPTNDPTGPCFPPMQ